MPQSSDQKPDAPPDRAKDAKDKDKDKDAKDKDKDKDKDAKDKDKVHEGTVVKAGDGKLTMTMKGEDKPHTHDVAKDAKITVDDKPAKLDDLKEGFHIKITQQGEPVVKIEAHSKPKDEDK